MRVLLVGIGDFYHVGAFFRNALPALGHQCVFLDESANLRPLGRSRFHRLAFHALGRRPLNYWTFNSSLIAMAKEFRPEVVLVTGRCHVSPKALREIKTDTGAVLVNYATDDPFSPVLATGHIIAGIPLYDLYACTKRAIMEDVKRAGCPHVCYVPFGYEPSLHFPETPDPPEQALRFKSDVVFIGGGDEDRLPYFETIAIRSPQLTMHLYGGNWEHFPSLRPFYRGYAMGRDFRLALCGAKITPCLVRRSNRDGHCMRTFEVPACGGFVLAERTDEHLELFQEGVEADFFGPPEELADKVAFYLNHESLRTRMADAAHRKIAAGGHTYQDRLKEILQIAKSI